MKLKVSLVTCASLLGLSAPAFAQTAPQSGQPTSAPANASGLSESADIIVTASKTGAQSVQKTTLAIQAFSGESLKERNVQDVSSLITAIPGASIANETAAGIKSYNIRGVGVGGTNGETPIGYYLDEVPFVVPNFGIAPPIRFLDLERVEVLRGPQGTLYGQGSAGGTIIFRTRDPDLTAVRILGEAYGSRTTAASGLNWGVSGALSLPIIKDVLAIRVSGGLSRQQGYADVYFGPNDGTPDQKDVNYQMNKDWRVAVLFKPSDKLTLRGQVWQFQPTQGFQSLYSDTSPYTYENTAGIGGYTRAKYTIYSLTGDLDLGGVAITSSTSYLKGSFGYRTPLGILGIPGGKFDSFFFPKNFNEEIRAHSTGAGPLHWVVGGSYSAGEGPQSNQLDFVVIQQSADNNTITRNWAGFGEISYDLLGGKLVPLVGVRYYHDRRSYEDATSKLPSTLEKTTWRVNLSYFPTDSISAFATVSTGFRVNTVQSALQVQLLQADGLPAKILLDPLSLTNYELGTRVQLFDHTLTLAANLYHIKYDGLQSGYTTSVGIGGFINTGRAHSTGLDLDLSWRTPLSGLTLSAVANINSSKYDEIDPRLTAQSPRITTGGQLLNSAKYNFRVDASYTRRVGAGLALVSNINLSRTGSRLAFGGLLAKPYSLLGATLGVRRGPYELALFGENLTDERGPTDYFVPTIMNGPVPRTIGLRVRKSY
jgi:iron complex outermembrane receptor protein